MVLGRSDISEDANDVNDYLTSVEFSGQYSETGGATGGSFTARLYRRGNIVIVTIISSTPLTRAISGTVFTTVQIPLGFRPSSERYCSLRIFDTRPATVIVLSSGLMELATHLNTLRDLLTNGPFGFIPGYVFTYTL